MNKLYFYFYFKYIFKMAWGFWKKIKNAFKKAGQWIKNKVIQPVVNFGKKVFTKAEPILNTAVKLAPAIGAAVGGAKGNPQLGAQAGMAIQGVGGALGLGK